MNNILHMDTEQARAAARQIKQSSREMEERIIAVLNSVQSVDWQGADRELFLVRLKAHIHQIRAQAQAGVALAQRVDIEADEWEATDQKSAAFWQETFTELGALGAVPVLIDLPATGSPGSVLGENTGVVEVDDYASNREEYDPAVEGNDYYGKAVERAGSKKIGEGEEHYRWRIMREINYLEALVTYYWQDSPSSLSPPELNSIVNFCLWLFEWNYANEYQQNEFPKWLNENSEPAIES